MTDSHVRFGVRSLDGGTTDIWKCWTTNGKSKRDVYLTSRPLGYAMKLSLHESGRWHVGFHAQKKDVLFSPETAPPSRFLGVWDRSSITAAPWVLGARVCFPWSSPSKPPRKAPLDTRWITCPSKGKMLEVAIFLVNSSIESDDWPGKGAMDTNLVGRFPLAGGGEVVIVSLVVEMWNGGLMKGGTPSYFRGKSKDDILQANRVVAWGESSDGSIVFIESRLADELGDVVEQSPASG